MNRPALQMIAFLTMIIDHVAIVAYGADWICSDLYAAMRAVGRIAYPLFAFMVSEGLHKTSDRIAYLKRLVCFGILAQLPYMFFGARGGIPSFLLENIRLNMLFAYALAVSFITCMEKFESLGEREQSEYLIVPILSIALIALLGNRCEYGLIGLAYVCCLYFAYPHRGRQCLIMMIWALIQYHERIASLVCAFCAAALIIFYNGQRGERRFPKYFLYWFYPAHLAVLNIIQQAIKNS